MKIVIFGLTVSSSWGNGHATLWRALCKALGSMGWRVIFFERDVPYYASHRDSDHLAGGKLVLYPDWESARSIAEEELADADIGLVTSYCPDGIAATELVLNSPVALRVFYDLDTPVTLGQLRRGCSLSYIGPAGLSGFDLVLSYTGGAALDALKQQLGARHVAPLFGSVDPEVHRPVAPVERYRADLSYLGTYAADRQEKVERLLIEPARQLPKRRFVLGGAQYPESFPWTHNLFFVGHSWPAEHSNFFCSSRLTLNVTRADMVAMGYCPSGRLFEASASATPILSDWWEGLDTFYTPGIEILVAETTQEAIEAIERSDAELKQIASAAFERTLSQYTAGHRAAELESLLEEALSERSSDRTMAAESLSIER